MLGVCGTSLVLLMCWYALEILSVALCKFSLSMLQQCQKVPALGMQQSTVQPSTAQRSTAQRSAAQHSTAKPSTA